MTNDELKKKIAQIIAKHLCLNKKSHFFLYGNSADCYNRDNFAECMPICDTVDALIAAGIGDISVMLEYVKSVGKHRDEERKNLIELQNIQLEYLQSRVKAAEHRAEVAKRALERTVFELLQAWGYSALMAAIRAEEFFIPEAIKEAEKELLEENKNA